MQSAARRCRRQAVCSCGAGLTLAVRSAALKQSRQARLTSRRHCGSQPWRGVIREYFRPRCQGATRAGDSPSEEREGEGRLKHHTTSEGDLLAATKAQRTHETPAPTLQRMDQTQPAARQGMDDATGGPCVAPSQGRATVLASPHARVPTPQQNTGDWTCPTPR